MSKLTHLDDDGRPHMVDVSGKDITARRAVAEGYLKLSPEALELARTGTAKKGDVLRTAELAGIMAAKKTADLIPLCHPLPLTGISVEITVESNRLRVEAAVKTTGKTGVEMEALSAATVACLTLYDMLKAVDKTMVIEDVSVIKKTGGKSGDFG
ncbi:MAG: cyclic pyranopterin monophosphate synthase MoaC [Henriciella sp.]